MYGPGSGGRGGGAGYTGGRGDGSARGPPKERRMTPRGSMSASADSRPPLQDLSPQLKMMFPRTPVIDKAVPIKRRAGIETKYTGLAALLSEFENTPPPKSTPVKNLEKEQEKRRRKAHRRNKKKVAAQMATYDPLNNTAATGNAFQTLFIARLSPNTTQESLQKMLEQYGPLRSVIIVSDRKGKSRRYAFAEFEYEDDMTEAYRKCNNAVLDDSTIIVDVERGRTVKGWLPTRLGGGMGGRELKKGKKEILREKFAMMALQSQENHRMQEEMDRRDREKRRRMKEQREGGGGYYGGSGGGYERGKRDRDERGYRPSGDRDTYRGGDRDRYGGGSDRDRDRDRDTYRGGDRDRYGGGSDRYGDRGNDRYGGDRRSDRDRHGGGGEKYGGGAGYRGGGYDRKRDREDRY